MWRKRQSNCRVILCCFLLTSHPSDCPDEDESQLLQLKNRKNIRDGLVFPSKSVSLQKNKHVLPLNFDVSTSFLSLLTLVTVCSAATALVLAHVTRVKKGNVAPLKFPISVFLWASQSNCQSSSRPCEQRT